MTSIKTAISLYSYQDEYARGKMSLEDCLKEVSEQGVDGVELISDQMMHNTPFVSNDNVAQWHKLLKKNNLVPVCNDIFVNTKLYRNRVLTQKENLEALKNELRLANRLGFKLVRLVSLIPTDIIESALPLAEELDVTMALEVHAGMALDHPETKKFTDIMLRVNSPYLGLVIDTGIFSRKHPRVSKQFFLAQGLNKDLADYIDNEFAEGRDVFDISHPGTAPAEVQALIKSELDQEYLIFAGGYENKPFSVLDKYVPFIKHFHGKFWEMTEQGVEYSIPYDEFIEYLKEKNFNGYIASEYEGNRFALPDIKIDAVNQVRLHQRMLKKYIGKEGVKLNV